MNNKRRKLSWKAGRQEAVEHLAAALDGYAKAGPQATDFEIARVELDLGRAYWALGGEHRSEPEFAHACFRKVAEAESPVQAHSSSLSVDCAKQ